MKPITHPSKRSSTKPARFAAAGTLALTFTGALLAPAATAAPAPAPAETDWSATAYRGQVDVVEGPDADQETIDGVAFADDNRNSVQDNNERGLAGVTVSNGRDVTTTDSHGRYELPAFDNMTVFVTQPRGYQVPVDEDNVAQFFYHHLPEGSPALRHGGIAPTGALPDAVNFPLAKSQLTQSPEQHCLIGGDIQTYTQEQVEFARNGAFADLSSRDDYAGCGALFIGDVVGDDLSLYPQTRELAGMLNGPARFLPGNHDLDFDAVDSAHNFDTFRAQLGPEYYSYDAGKAHVVALNTVEYPTKQPAAKGDYTGSLDEKQLEWLRNDIAAVPENKLIVLAAHIPLLDYADQGSAKHQVAQVKEIYEILEGRKVVALGGHTHSIENLREGDSLEGWSEIFGIDGLPFTHITAGATSSDWYSGRELAEGYPLAVQRDGGLPGVFTLDIKNTDFQERFTVRGADESLQIALGLNTPRYREWYAENVDNKGSATEFADPLVVSRDDLANTTWLTTNFWMGSTGSTVKVKLDGETTEAVRTQQMQGEGQLVGSEYSDPVAVQEQLVRGGSLADRMMHLWRLELPSGLAVGLHTAEVTATDVHGRQFTETLTFEVTE
ncbi:metallophosphoesterase domain-containing protein [Arthrobacter crystallopoietes BAB-32]|uniref:Metallophosphoesterase domain-containing protein n=1 Tax=Arthrobacter crystallopoietes BAB-32 TaxID=1246476 RepID=N1UY15_9MICC|nr:calcineurin-like phosphoesterase family protein [Arthrobacter crystallopoietes]EMY33950.1 metallophosphoesterase domain-containing protein [Arthrobacter crystallopoietes BAB-32]